MAPGARRELRRKLAVDEDKAREARDGSRQIGGGGGGQRCAGREVRLFENAQVGIAPVLIAHRGQAALQQPLQGLAPMRERRSSGRLQGERRSVLGRDTGEKGTGHAASLITQS